MSDNTITVGGRRAARGSPRPTPEVVVGSDPVEADPRRLDAEDPGDGGAEKRRDDEDMEQSAGPDIGEKEGEEEGRLR